MNTNIQLNITVKKAEIIFLLTNMNRPECNNAAADLLDL